MLLWEGGQFSEYCGLYPLSLVDMMIHSVDRCKLVMAVISAMVLIFRLICLALLIFLAES